MKILPGIIIFTALSACTTSGISSEAGDKKTKGNCDRPICQPIKDTKFKGISFASLSSEPVILVEQIKQTEVLQASIKDNQVVLVKIAKRAALVKKPKLKVQFGGGQSNGAGGVFGQSEDGVTLIQPAGEAPVLICGETQNPCVVDEDIPGTEGGCGSEFGRPEDDESLGDYYGTNQAEIDEFCEQGGNSA